MPSFPLEPNLQHLAELAYAEDVALDTFWFEPDGKFQTKAISYGALATQVAGHLRDSFLYHLGDNDFPKLCYACGKARVGSTALANVFGCAGIPSYYQPVKTMLRRVLMEQPFLPWKLKPGSDVHFAKETFGPYTHAESIFLPIELLLDAGFPADKIHVIILDREPASALASWLAHWKHRLPEARLVQHYIIASLNTQRVRRYAKINGLANTTYVYELSRQPHIFIERLFKVLAISDHFSMGSIRSWGESGDLDSEKSKIVFPEEPQIYDVPGLHGADVAYRFRERSCAASLPARYTNVLEDNGMYELYDRSLRACMDDFSIEHNVDTCASCPI